MQSLMHAHVTEFLFLASSSDHGRSRLKVFYKKFT